MEWIKKHVDTAVVLGGILSAVLWMNGQFREIDNRFAIVEKDLAIIKTVLIMKDIMPKEIASKKEQLPKELATRG